MKKRSKRMTQRKAPREKKNYFIEQMSKLPSYHLPHHFFYRLGFFCYFDLRFFDENLAEKDFPLNT